MTHQPMSDDLARTKLHARLHDPAEKALVLLRDPAGHEGATVRHLREKIVGKVSAAQDNDVRRADWWASAADRPQFPRARSDHRFSRWSQVRFDQQPVLRHPLSGDTLDLREQGALGDTDIDAIKTASEAHFEALVQYRDDGAVDPWRTLLALWRFGPEPAVSADGEGAGLGELWRFLPADTRIPDHSIWQHLDFTSALAGAFRGDADGQCALLSVSLGPVQEFIAAARTTSDLWAGSHLLSRLAWEAMRVVCERLGPDAVLFPALRGVPQVDLWLIDQGLDPSLFASEPWRKAPDSDANPLFSAALPNRFSAVVPAAQAEALAGAIQEHLRTWVDELGTTVVDTLLETAELAKEPDTPAYEQVQQQLRDFPEVHWASVGWSELAVDAQGRPDAERLAQALRPFHGDAEQPGFLGSPAWRVLQEPVTLDDPESGEQAVFYRPNPGVLYPALHELTERVLGASKVTRAFSQRTEHGYRCSLTGEVEWLTHDRSHLRRPPGERSAADTLWSRIAVRRPAWARKGEHLGALAAIKRLWPTLFCRELGNRSELGARAPSRFVVSTHTMALATTLDRIADEGLSQTPDERVAARIGACERVALPRKLAGRLRDHEDGDVLARLPAWIDAVQEDREQDDASAADKTVRQLTGRAREGYYALLLMDGDRMGRWLSSTGDAGRTYREAFHPEIERVLAERFGDQRALQAYLDAPRAVSPAYHLAVSGALNAFSNLVARDVLERQYNGRVLYGGGDDLMAMLPTGDLLAAMQALRHAYSGTGGGDGARGYYRCQGRLHVCMGPGATASMGAVIAHHQTPLTAALAELHRAQATAKQQGGRNAFSLSLLKRSGGAIRHTGRWQPPAADVDEVTTIGELSETLAHDPGASRRAAYNIEEWLTHLPEPAALGGHDGTVTHLESVLHHQFCRQGLEKPKQPIHSRRLARLAAVTATGAVQTRAADVGERVAGLTGIAEFLAREARR